MSNETKEAMMNVSSYNPPDELKIYELSRIWKEAEYNFAFWEKLEGTLDWNQAYKEALPRVLATNSLFEYYLELMRFVALLRDGHTYVQFPPSIWEDENVNTGLPVMFNFFNGRYIINRVDESVINIVKPGSIVHKINGIDIEEFVETNIYPFIWHEKKDNAIGNMQVFLRGWSIGDKVEIEIEYEGKIETITLFKTTYLVRLGDEFKFDLEIDGKVETAVIHETFSPSNFIGLNQNLSSSDKLTIIYESDSHKISFTEDNIAVITITTFGNNDLPSDFYANYSLLENAAGYIIDVRDNGGGNSENGDTVSAVFIGKDFTNQRALHRMHMGVFKAWGSFQNYGDASYEQILERLVEEYGEDILADSEEMMYYERIYKIPRRKYFEESIGTVNISDLNIPGILNAPLVVLSSRWTVSAAEDFLINFDTANRATIVGTASYGSTGQPLMFPLKSGGTVRICTRWNTYPDGREFINIGVQPHIPIENTLEDLKNGVDAVMNKGLEEVRRQIGNQ
ncbi:MAG: S41 family peptidase [Candidatus Cloacimonetes bacterium]|nr:S41 family peptidase [Candidatus Cloacimonadota bacterium]